MLNFGLFEIAIIMALVLVFVGPERLPTMVRFLGRQYGKLMRASDELRRAFVIEADREDAEARAEALRKRREAARKRAEAARQRALDARDRGDEPPVEPVARDPERSKLTEQDAMVAAAAARAGATDLDQVDLPPAELPGPAAPNAEELPEPSATLPVAQSEPVSAGAASAQADGGSP